MTRRKRKKTKAHVTIEEVTQAYKDCRKHKRGKASALEYEMNYISNNYQLYKDLNRQTYEIGESMAFCVTRPKLREVFAANFRDRIVHHIIYNKFIGQFEKMMSDDIYSCRVKKGNLYGVGRLDYAIKKVSDTYKKETWVLKCDLEGFFMSINKEILYKQLCDVLEIDDDWWKWLLKVVVMHRPEEKCIRKGDVSLWNDLPAHKSLFKSNGKGLPIGNLTSQVFANVYLNPFDRYVESLLTENERYGRYVDDFYIVSNDKGKLLKMLPKMRKFLFERLELRLHPHKVYIQECKKGIEFVGAVIKPNRIYLGNRTVGHFYDMIREWNSDTNPDNERYIKRYNSYSGFLVQYHTYAIRRKAWSQIRHMKFLTLAKHSRFIKIKKKNIPSLRNDEFCYDNIIRRRISRNRSMRKQVCGKGESQGV